MAKAASDRLIERVKPFQSKGAIGITCEEISKVPLSPEFFADILECLKSNDVSEIGWGLWFSQGVLNSKPPQEFLKYLVSQLPLWMAHENVNIRGRTLPLLIRLRGNFPTYRARMLKCLQDSSAEIRMTALASYDTFLTKKDIPLLLEFRSDPHKSETFMNSPLVYLIRNQALETTERIIGKQFSKHENVEITKEGLTVYWWDWKPFLDWWEKSQIRRKFWE